MIALAAAFVFLYLGVLTKLGTDWWSDENYSHGLLVPFVIAFIVWREWETIRSSAGRGEVLLGGTLCGIALFLVLGSVLGAELLTGRISMVLMIGAVLVYLFGTRILKPLIVPFALLLLAIPVPQIIFNKIAFPLQIWASKMAVSGIRLFDVPTVRNGNVIDILPAGATQAISLEVVEACSGIRSLMTLVALALVLAYFTRRSDEGKFAMGTKDLWRAGLLMLSAIPIAVVTNAARVTTTGILTFYYGRRATDGYWHDLSGWLVYVVALVMLIGVNYLFSAVVGKEPEHKDLDIPIAPHRSTVPVYPLIALLAFGALTVTWLNNRGEAVVEHTPLASLPSVFGDWRQAGGDIRFDDQVEDVLRTSDYVMRVYSSHEGRTANVYVGYYASQRTGATYHSPRNCLPGAGWVMSDPQLVNISTVDGKEFQANRYIIQTGAYREVMIYWYQGRGHKEASEYRDKITTVWDSITRRRTDGALVRVMTDARDGGGPAAEDAAADLAARLADSLDVFIPQ